MEVAATTVLALIALGLGVGWLSYRLRMRDLLDGLEAHIRAKRCPKATDHLNACSDSNEPGQPGSAYPKTHFLDSEHPRCVDAGDACTDCMARGWCLNAPTVRAKLPAEAADSADVA